jgi:hypothetical protein
MRTKKDGKSIINTFNVEEAIVTAARGRKGTSVIEILKACRAVEPWSIGYIRQTLSQLMCDGVMERTSYMHYRTTDHGRQHFAAAIKLLK